MVRNSTSTQSLCCTDCTLRIFQLKDIKSLKLPTSDWNSNIHITRNMKKQGNMTPPKLNHITVTNSNSEVDETTKNSRILILTE
jgi:hypothetical protein